MTIKIDQAFIKRILEGGLEIDIVHEDGNYSQWGSYYTHITGVYTPTASRPYLEIKNFPSITSAFSVADTDEHLGLFQVIIRYPVDAAGIAIKRKAEQVLSLLKVGATLLYEDQKIFIDSNSRDGGRVEGGFYQIVARANYRAYVNR